MFTAVTAFKIGDCPIDFLNVFINCVPKDGGQTIHCTRDSLPHPVQNKLTENLETLTLVDCCLNELKLDTFKRTGQLRHLDASHNNLKTLQMGTFENIRQLELLNMSHNKLEDLDDLVFETTNQLQHLDLSYNFLRVLSYPLFRRTTKLMLLKLDHNNILFLHPEIFHGLLGLVQLDLSHNFLRGLDYSLFSDTISLKILDLSFNSLLGLAIDVFSELGQLTTLILNENSLSALDPHLFVALVNLEHLDLGNNQLKNVSSRLFKSQKQLKVLSLRGNVISSIGEDQLSPLRALRELDLSDNPLVCNCTFYGMVQWSRKRGIPVDKMDEICIFTIDRTTMNWAQLCQEQRDVTTEPLVEAIVIGIGVATVLLFVTILFSVCLWKRIKRARRKVPGIMAEPRLQWEVYDDVGPYYLEGTAPQTQIHPSVRFQTAQVH
ncbi:hypothetical protein C0J52_28465 [Blattella germanica]|nr:hypothetical protein C0J52_28465 [Blattella germanica]